MFMPELVCVWGISLATLSVGSVVSGVVQTAYANGGSTLFLEKELVRRMSSKCFCVLLSLHSPLLSQSHPPSIHHASSLVACLVIEYQIHL